MKNELENKIRLLLDMEIKRFCFRNGRHGETYLLDRGIQNGLIESIVPKIVNLLEEKPSGKSHSACEEFGAPFCQCQK